MYSFLQTFYNYFRRRMKRKPVRFVIKFKPVGKRGTLPMSPSITAIQDVAALATPVDAKGNVVTASFPTPPSWSTSDSTILTVAPAADGLSAVVTAVGKLGTASVSVSGTPAGETSPITGSATVTVTAAQAASFVLTFGTPATQNPGTPPPPAPPPAA